MSFTAHDYAEDIHHFWFSNLDESKLGNLVDFWFSKNPETDKNIQERFSHLFEEFQKGDLDFWREGPKTSLSLILLLDQFSRNVFRDTPKAFAFDPAARDLHKHILNEGWENLYHPFEKLFLYLPLEHSESLEDQELSIKKFSALKESVSPELQGFADNIFDYAQRHYDVIKQFGRFPHRNKILGRESSPEEVDFLKQPHSSF